MGFAPSIAFGLGTNHEVTLSHLWVKTQDRPDYGIPFVNKRPNETMAKAGNYYGVDGNFDDSETNVSTFELPVQDFAGYPVAHRAAGGQLQACLLGGGRAGC
jgi:outer membrane receptor for monomeric catechols